MLVDKNEFRLLPFADEALSLSRFGGGSEECDIAVVTRVRLTGVVRRKFLPDAVANVT